MKSYKAANNLHESFKVPFFFSFESVHINMLVGCKKYISCWYLVQKCNFSSAFEITGTADTKYLKSEPSPTRKLPDKTLEGCDL